MQFFLFQNTMNGWMKILNGTLFYLMNDKKQRSIYWKLTGFNVIQEKIRSAEMTCNIFQNTPATKSTFFAGRVFYSSALQTLQNFISEF